MANPSVNWTFGSFGDALGIVDHAWSIGQTLLDIAGASAQWRTLREDVRTFIQFLRALKETRAIQPELSRHAPLSLPGDIAASIVSCATLLSEMTVILEQYHTPAFAKRLWYRIWWAVSGKDDFAQKYTSFSSRVMSLNMLLQIMHG